MASTTFVVASTVALLLVASLQSVVAAPSIDYLTFTPFSDGDSVATADNLNGYPVAYLNSYAYIGTPTYYVGSNDSSVGAVYIFLVSGSTASQVSEITPFYDASNELALSGTGFFFGGAVAVFASSTSPLLAIAATEFLLVSPVGYVYIYSLTDPSTPEFVHKLTNPASAGAMFGSALAYSSTGSLVVAPSAVDTAGCHAYIFGSSAVSTGTFCFGASFATGSFSSTDNFSPAVLVVGDYYALAASSTGKIAVGSISECISPSTPVCTAVQTYSGVGGDSMAYHAPTSGNGYLLVGDVAQSKVHIFSCSNLATCTLSTVSISVSSVASLGSAVDFAVVSQGLAVVVGNKVTSSIYFFFCSTSGTFNCQAKGSFAGAASSGFGAGLLSISDSEFFVSNAGDTDIVGLASNPDWIINPTATPSATPTAGTSASSSLAINGAATMVLAIVLGLCML